MIFTPNNLFVLLVCLCSIDLIFSMDHLSVNQRRKRYLNFPNKAAFVLTCSLLKGVANEVYAGPTVKIVTIHELDVIFPLPHDPSPFELSQTALGQPPIFHQSHTRHRRDIYRQLEDLLYLQGHDGRACLLKTLCEAKTLPETNEENFLQEMLTIIFSFPVNDTFGLMEEYYIDKKKCSIYSKSCPFSIFDLAFDWADMFSKLYYA